MPFILLRVNKSLSINQLRLVIINQSRIYIPRITYIIFEGLGEIEIYMKPTRYLYSKYQGSTNQNRLVPEEIEI